MKYIHIDVLKKLPMGKLIRIKPETKTSNIIIWAYQDNNGNVKIGEFCALTGEFISDHVFSIQDKI